ncbi:MAG: NAD(P)H-dependent oxidoreductase [Lachnospiraceae bacterium]|nr:NAD(P)H-dependent oxidoreductase [Lachnospiraceae bacterium]
MKILIINGGPRKGNTWRLTMVVKKMLKRFDSSIRFREVHLSEVGLPFCLGCSNCFRKGHQTCPHYQKIRPIMDLIEECDAVIFSVPCYQGHLPGIMKNFTDHLAFLLHRPRYFKKKALIISTTGGVSAGSTTKALASTLSGWGFNKSYQLPITAFSWNDYHPTKNDLRKTCEVTHRFYLDVNSGKMHTPSLGVVIPFNLFQAMCIGNKGEKDYPTEDNRFWPKYKGMNYAPGIPLTLLHRLLGTVMYLVGKMIAGNVVISYKK